jgi:hypothetical protein
VDVSPAEPQAGDDRHGGFAVETLADQEAKLTSASSMIEVHVGAAADYRVGRGGGAPLTQHQIVDCNLFVIGLKPV